MTPRSRRRGGHQDPTFSRARIGGAGGLLRGLPDDQVRVLVAVIVYGMTDDEIAEYFGLPVDQVLKLLVNGMRGMVHPSRYEALPGLAAELAGGASWSPELREMTRRLGVDTLGRALQCSRCERPTVEPLWLRQKRGRPRRYCSDACRQAAYRARRAAARAGSGGADAN